MEYLANNFFVAEVSVENAREGLYSCKVFADGEEDSSDCTWAVWSKAVIPTPQEELAGSISGEHGST